MTPAETGRILAQLKAAYPRQAIEPDTLRVYAAHLLPFPAAAIAEAVRDHVRGSRFFPTIAELLELAALNEFGSPAPSEAWADVVGELRRVGHTGSPRFCDPLIHEVVQKFGWRRLCDSTNLPTDRARFIELYEARLLEQTRAFQLAGTEQTARALNAAPTLRVLAGGDGA